jgi:L-seryl-tRNA(Ser) seleniumtransferase
LRPVINATGVIINTNLGRAPLSSAAVEAMAAVARDYSNLEYDLESGGRGSRQAHVRALLKELAGAEDALVVNNNAAALLVVLSALAAGREVIVSRGELVEIGGGFRVPDVMRQGGAKLVEVGTTNRTRLRDYEDAITPETAALLTVHPSNFRIVGFTESPDVAALAALAHARGLPLVHDLGSGALLPTEIWGLAHEPMVRESVASGVDIVCFSGDKLLGGPQAGIIAGRAALLERVARHPLMRAVRCDKLTLAALEVTLRQHRDGLAEREIPVWRCISLTLESIRERAARWAGTICGWGVRAHVEAGEATVGGGSLPGETLPTVLCTLDGSYLAVDSAGGVAPPPAPFDVAALAARLRTGTPPVVARVSRGQLLLDPRTVLPGQDADLLLALRSALTSLENS